MISYVPWYTHSHTMILQFCSTFPMPEFYFTLHVGASLMCKSNDNLSAECAILPPSKNVTPAHQENTIHHPE